MKGDIIQGVDILDLVYFIARKNKKFQAILLQDIEKSLGKDSEHFQEVRKLILDSYNNYTRAILKIIFGNDFDV